MKQRTLQTQKDLEKAGNDILALADHLPCVLTVTQGTKIRSSEANARYWVNLDHAIQTIDQEINRLSDKTGYTNMEIRELVAKEIGFPRSMILGARRPEVVHEIMKMICNIPTSTRLGTKEFSKFELIMENTLSDIISEVIAITGNMA